MWQQSYLRAAPEPSAWPRLVGKVNALDRAGLTIPRERLRGLRAPTLLLIGDADIVRPEHVIEMFRLLGGGVPGDVKPLPAAQLAVLPGTNHVDLLDRVEWVVSMVTRFLHPST